MDECVVDVVVVVDVFVGKGVSVIVLCGLFKELIFNVLYLLDVEVGYVFCCVVFSDEIFEE